MLHTQSSRVNRSVSTFKLSKSFIEFERITYQHELCSVHILLRTGSTSLIPLLLGVLQCKPMGVLQCVCASVLWCVCTGVQWCISMGVVQIWSYKFADAGVLFCYRHVLATCL